MKLSLNKKVGIGIFFLSLFCLLVFFAPQAGADTYYDFRWGNEYDLASGDVGPSGIYANGVVMSLFHYPGYVGYTFDVPAGIYTSLTITVFGVGLDYLGANLVIYNYASGDPAELVGYTSIAEGPNTFTSYNPMAYILPYNSITFGVGTNWDGYSLNYIEITADYIPPAPSPPAPPTPPASTTPPPSSTTSPIDRLWGQTSEGTAAAISQAGWGSSKVVLIARNDHFADALAGVPLAYAFRNVPSINSPVPLLLTTPRGLSSEARQEIQRLGAETVIILGGPGAILPQVEADLASTPGVKEVQRIWGETAPGTARDIHQRIRSYTNPTPDTVIIATQVNFQDALAVSSPAAANNMPILLTNLYSLPQETLEALSQGGIKSIIIVGGGAVVSGEVEADLSNRGYNVLVRFWGKTEYDTAVDIALDAYKRFNFTKPGPIFVARGDFFTDALTGGALASRMNPAPILLTHPGGLSASLSSYLGGGKYSITKVYILGGPGAFPQNLQTEIQGLVQ